MLERLVEDYPATPEETLLAWANMAKNSMQNIYGFSPNQLVFGTNPNLPNILTDGLPALDGKTSSEVFAHHMNALHASRKAFIESESSDRIRRALRKNVSTVNRVWRHGDTVWYKRERDARWKGPAKVIFQDGKVIWVRHGSTAVRVSANRLIKQGEEYVREKQTKDIAVAEDDIVSSKTSKPVVEVDDTEEFEVTTTQRTVDDNIDKNNDYLEGCEEHFDNNETIVGGGQEYENIDDHTLDESTVMTDEGKRKRSVVREESRNNKRLKSVFPPSRMEKIQLKKDDWIEMTEDGDEWLRARIINREKVNGKYYNYFNVVGEDGLKRNVDLERARYNKIPENEEVNMVLIPREEQQNEECKKAKLVELRKLEDFKSFKVVEDKGQFRISCRWVLWKKEEETRARLVARGFEEESEVPSDSPTVDKANLRVILAVAAAEGWMIETSDVKSAFLQGRTLDRKVTIIPPKEAGVPKGKLWQLQVALYGLDDASLQFFLKCKEVLLKLGCVQSTFDPAMFMKYDSESRLIGIIATHVDDFIHAGNEVFRITVTKKLAEIFKMGKTEAKRFKYVGYDLEQLKEGIKISQREYAEKLEIPEIDPSRLKAQDDELTSEEKTLIRQVAGQIGWLARETRPDLSFAQVEMSTKFVKGKVKDLVQAVKSITRAKQSDSRLTISALGPVEGWSVEVSTDASLSNLNDGVHSTGAYVILIKNKSGNCAPISWRSGKIRRIVDSTLECECLALVDGLKQAVYVREIIEEIFNLDAKSVNVQAVVDNKSTVQAIHSTAPVEDKKLRRDISIIKQMLNEKDISSVSWCPGKEQLADCMTKRTAPTFNLLSVFQSGKREGQ